MMRRRIIRKEMQGVVCSIKSNLVLLKGNYNYVVFTHCSPLLWTERYVPVHILLLRRNAPQQSLC